MSTPFIDVNNVADTFDAERGDTGLVYDANGDEVPGRLVRGCLSNGWVCQQVMTKEGYIVQNMQDELEFEFVQHAAPLTIRPIPPDYDGRQWLAKGVITRLPDGSLDYTSIGQVFQAGERPTATLRIEVLDQFEVTGDAKIPMPEPEKKIKFREFL